MKIKKYGWLIFLALMILSVSSSIILNYKDPKIETLTVARIILLCIFGILFIYEIFKKFRK